MSHQRLKTLVWLIIVIRNVLSDPTDQQRPPPPPPDGNKPPPDGQQPPLPPLQDGPQPQSSPRTTNIPTNCYTKCQSQITQNAKIPDLTDCHKYYQCRGASSNSALMSCPNGQNFDTSTCVCSQDAVCFNPSTSTNGSLSSIVASKPTTSPQRYISTRLDSDTSQISMQMLTSGGKLNSMTTSISGSTEASRTVNNNEGLVVTSFSTKTSVPTTTKTAAVEITESMMPSFVTTDKSGSTETVMSLLAMTSVAGSNLGTSSGSIPTDKTGLTETETVISSLVMTSVAGSDLGTSNGNIPTYITGGFTETETVMSSLVMTSVAGSDLGTSNGDLLFISDTTPSLISSRTAIQTTTSYNARDQMYATSGSYGNLVQTTPRDVKFKLSISLINNSSSSVVEGDRVEFKCVYSGFYYRDEFIWSLNGRPLENTSRISIVDKSGSDYWTSSLVFNPVIYADSGNVSCMVSYSDRFVGSNNSILRVYPLPTVHLDKAVISTEAGSQIVINCTAVVPVSEPGQTKMDLKVFWFQDTDLSQDSSYVTQSQNGPGQLKIESTFSVNVSRSTTVRCVATIDLIANSSVPCFVTVLNNQEIKTACQPEMNRNISWQLTKSESRDMQACPDDMSGYAYRACNKDGIWDDPDLQNCTSKTFVSIDDMVRQCENRNGPLNKTMMGQIASSLAQMTNNTMTSAELLMSVDDSYRMSRIRNQSVHYDIPMTEVQLLIQTVSNILRSDGWDLINSSTSAVQLLQTVNLYGDSWNRQLMVRKDSDWMPLSMIQYDNFNLVNVFFECNTTDMNPEYVSFPHWPTGSNSAGNNIRVSSKTFDDILKTSPMPNISTSASYLTKLSNYLPVTNQSTYINSAIISLEIFGMTSANSFQPPVNIQLEHLNANSSYTGSCVFWKFSSEMDGHWSNEGCQTISSNISHTVCSCNHLTNFAILFSPSPATGINDIILSFISLIGCIISIAALVLTLIIYAVRWKSMKSKQAVILVNLCISLLLANIAFIAGVNRTEIKPVCTAIAALLHYLYLSAFFMMLLEGVLLLVSVFFVFCNHRRSHVILFVFLAWFLPMIIVGVSLGVTRLEGYGSSEHCWLSIENGLLWAFVGPALFIILVNFIIMVSVLGRIVTANIPTDIKRKRNKIKSVLRNIAVVNPVLGITWVFGVLSVNQNLVVFQYIFAISNSLQGLFIFLLHGVCHTKVVTKDSSSRWDKASHRKSTSSVGNQRISRATSQPWMIHAMAAQAASSNENLIQLSPAEQELCESDEVAQPNNHASFRGQLSNASMISTATASSFVSNSSRRTSVATPIPSTTSPYVGSTYNSDSRNIY